MLEGNQRAKIETTDGVVHIVLFHLTYDDEVRRLASSTSSSGRASCSPSTTATGIRAPRHHLRSGLEPILKRGPDHLLWALADDLVDGYFPFADQIGDAIDDVQDEVVREADAGDASSSCSSSSAS